MLLYLLALYSLLTAGLCTTFISSPRNLSDFTKLSNADISELFHRLSREDDRHSTLERRWAGGVIPEPASEEMWEKFKCKGRKFVAQMAYSDFDVGQMLPTPATTAQSPCNFRVGDVYRNFAAGGYWGVAGLLQHIGISTTCHEEGGKWIAAVITHYITGYRGPDGHVRRVFGAYFYMAVTAEGGIMVQNVLGPRAAADKFYNNYQDYELPHLKSLSDMMWAMWEYYVPENARSNINLVMSLRVTNPESLAPLRRAMDSAQQPLHATPYKFEMDTDGALALLGSPNGAAIAHFLVQRKNLIGMKTVTGVYVFKCESRSRAPCLMFTVGPIQAVPRPQEQNARSEPNRKHQQRNIVRQHIFTFGEK